GYMSPEQARGVSVDKRADIWAYGVVLYEMLTGGEMFVGETVSDTLAAVLRADLDLSALPSDAPTSIRRLLRRCLERDRKKRQPTSRMRGWKSKKRWPAQRNPLRRQLSARRRPGLGL